MIGVITAVVTHARGEGPPGATDESSTPIAS